MATHAGTGARTTGRGGTRVASRLATETKQAFKTTEFWAFIAAVVGVLVAAQIVSSGNGSGTGADNNGDAFNASRAWLYITILTVGYMVSRGFAKAGVRDPFWSDGDNDSRD
jgi:uncharacterized membrane protein YjgN (DUF898 family)